MDPARYEAAPTFEAYLASVRKHVALWHGIAARVRLPETLIAAAPRGSHRLAVLSEDWCGDAANTVPVAARLAESLGWDFRVFGREANPDLMDAHLTDGRSRSIPVVIVYDADFRELGWWGPRPRELQRRTLGEGRALSPAERYKAQRRWYARDRGRSTVAEILEVVSGTP